MLFRTLTASVAPRRPARVVIRDPAGVTISWLPGCMTEPSAMMRRSACCSASAAM